MLIVVYIITYRKQYIYIYNLYFSLADLQAKSYTDVYLNMHNIEVSAIKNTTYFTIFIHTCEC